MDILFTVMFLDSLIASLNLYKGLLKCWCRYFLSEREFGPVLIARAGVVNQKCQTHFIES